MQHATGRGIALLMVSLLALLAGEAAEARDAGKVLFTKGPVSAERAPPIPLAKGATVLVQDTIVTGEAARAQLRMLDGSKFAIRENSRVQIEEFLFSPEETSNADQGVASARQDAAVYKLIKGGFRSVTGAIVKENNADIKVRTPVGTLGIRGTDYAVLLCQDDCDAIPKAGKGALENGLHVNVSSGIVVFRNELGEIELTAGQSIVIPFTNRQARRIASEISGQGDSEESEETDKPIGESPDPPITPCWACVVEIISPPSLPATGTAEYALISNTPPINNIGNFGVVGSASLLADFTSLMVFSTLALNINQSAWFASGSGNIGAAANLPNHQFSGSYDVDSCGNGCGGSGSFVGFFTGFGSSGNSDLPGSVGLTYTLTDSDLVETVSGGLAFANPVANQNRTIGWSSALASNPSFSGIKDNSPGQYFLLSNNLGGKDLLGFAGPYPTGLQPVEASFELGTASNTNRGSDPLTGLLWGRWSGGTAPITLSDGSDVSLDLFAQSLHWISSPEWMTPPAMPMSGLADYSLIGNTQPTDRLGNSGVLGSASLSANFTTMQVFSTLGLDFFSTQDPNLSLLSISASGSADIGAAAGLPAHQFFGIYDDVFWVNIDAVSPGVTGTFSGFFSTPGSSGSGLPGGAALTYTIGNSVSGALVFGRPSPAQNRTISWSTPLINEFESNALFSGTRDNAPGEYAFEPNRSGVQGLVGFVGPYPTAFDQDRVGILPVQAAFGIGTASNSQSSDSLTMLRWGRWAGGMTAITLQDGSDVSEDLSQQKLHWVAGPNWMTPPVMPSGGTASYTLIGSTSPTNNFGNVGVVGSATFIADFTAMQVFNTLDVDVGLRQWFASGTGDLGAAAGLPAHQFSGTYDIVDTCGDGCDGSGVFSGFFSTPGSATDPDLPGGVGLTYTITDSEFVETVSGSLVFGNPEPVPPNGG